MFRALTLAVLLLSICNPGFAATRFIDNDVTTIDTLTGLEWLDVTESAGIPYNSVTHQLAAGGRFEGYRHATRNEVIDIFLGFNLPSHLGPKTDSVQMFIDFFGNTSPLSSYTQVAGYADPEGDYITPGWPSVPIYSVSTRSDSDNVNVSRAVTWHNPDLAYNGFGSYLVRQFEGHHDVPEIDAASTPMALGILLMTYLIRRERRRSAK